MKKIFLILICVVVLTTVPVYAAEEQQIKVNLNGEYIDFDVKPTAINGRTMVPMRAIFEMLGLEVLWDGETKTVTGLGDEKEIKLQIGNTTAYIDGKEVELDVPASIIGGRTLVPIRFITEAVGGKVAWDGDTRTVLISTLEKPSPLVINSDEKIIIEYIQPEKIKFSQDTVNLPRYGDCNISLEGESDYEYIIVIVEAPNESFNRELYRVENGKFKTDTWLRHGPGAYLITFYGGDSISGDYSEVAAIFVNNINYFYSKEDVPIQANYINDELITLSETTLKAPYCSDKIRLSGTSLNNYFLIAIEKDGQGQEIIEPIKVKEGEFDVNIWLKYGPGDYDIYVYAGNFLHRNFKKILAIEAESNIEEDKRYILPSITIESDNEEIIQLARELTEEKETEMEKVMAIHDWVATKIDYDVKSVTKDNFNVKSALDTYRTRMGVCNDYAELVAALCRAVGIPAKVVVGDAGNDEDGWEKHAWNEVYVEEKWIIIDTTWDAGYIRGRKFRDYLSYEYFNPSLNHFSKDHKKEMDLPY